MSSWSRIASTISLSPWTTLRMPSGSPASCISHAHRDRRVAPDGFRTKALPAAMAFCPNIHIGIIAEVERGDAAADAERLAHRINVDPGPAPIVYSPFSA